ncbi:ATP-binding protein [Sphaerisporangium sp. NPDC005289]|uniref:ATP-binding protein n=1 Tax=Sphaerisporangium sp. NPDC005289 TaxID=3155247 RepID=UPI0033A0F796
MTTLREQKIPKGDKGHHPRNRIRQRRAITVTEEQTKAALGFYLVGRHDGFVVHMNVCEENLRAVREATLKVLTGAGVDIELAESARLIASELIGNAVRACGHWAPVIVEVEQDARGIWVKVHDPNPARLPVRSGTAPDDPNAESGRGLWLLDALAPGWDVALTPVGKQVRCLLPSPEAVRVRITGESDAKASPQNESADLAS